MRSEKSQITLILSGIIVTILFGIFLFREIYPEYKIYQEDYIALEEFRSTYTHQPPAAFQVGIKQIVIEREDKGPPLIDRCTSCHVALQIPYFSPTKIAHDLNGNVVRDGSGYPLKVPNEDYIWAKLDQKIAELRDSQVLGQLKSQGDESAIKARLALADQYESLKTAKVDEHIYDVTKALQMHPLMGNETRPFEFHSPNEIGCTSCHNGNGRGLTTDKAHGPVFDGQYGIEYEGPTPQFTERDEKNDPAFARVFNDKPGHELLFQTQPIFVGTLIQAKCMYCHQTSNEQLSEVTKSTSLLEIGREKEVQALLDAYMNDKQALSDLLQIKKMIADQGYELTLKSLKEKKRNFSLPPKELSQVASQINYVEKAGQQDVLKKIDNELLLLVGSRSLMEALEKVYVESGSDAIDPFLKAHKNDAQATGALFVKAAKLDFDQDLLQHAEDVDHSLTAALHDPKNITALSSDVNNLTQDFQRGKELFVAQACYACHRIATVSRGGVGPELTNAGYDYPWFLKRSIVWPQADVRTSTMPNMRMDHRELEDLMTFLFAQKGPNKGIAQTAYQADLSAWEAGRKLPWEKPVAPAEMEDLRFAMTVFATQGCAACHRLQGFDSNVGFKIEKDKPDFDQLYEQQTWFKKLFPEVIHISQYDEELPGSEIVKQIEKHEKEIDARIVSDVRSNGLLEEIDRNHPETIESYYSPFRYASRAKNDYFDELAKQEKDPEKLAVIKAQQKAWKERVHRILMMYIQTYGLGRLIGPHLNWSGIYRTDEWLMEHFHNPAAHVPRSLMPVMPFDDTKFYALTNMLDRLGIRNRNATREIWQNKGFNPAEAFTIHCAQCHGSERQGNGANAEWIYPIPKNLRNADFLRNLTKEQAINSITHGVKGTPMPPWGEVAEDKSVSIKKLSEHIPVLNTAEIEFLVDWLYSTLPGGEVIRETGVPKWKYEPIDVLEELRREGSHLKPSEELSNPPPPIKREIKPQENNPPIKGKLIPEKNPEEPGTPDQRTEPEKARPATDVSEIEYPLYSYALKALHRVAWGEAPGKMEKKIKGLKARHRMRLSLGLMNYRSVSGFQPSDAIAILTWGCYPRLPCEALSAQRTIYETSASIASMRMNQEYKYRGYYAALEPLVYPRQPQVEDVFDVLPNKNDSTQKNYYIKKKYYTPENIHQGQAFFLINCAACHGNEADGTGARSVAMQEAKPRMLTNLDWINSRDDLRLLRSIKYGVPGTAMTPWGDFTSSLQRLQLVIFIRSLSEERDLRELLAESLYRTFDIALVKIEDARINISQQIQKLNKDEEPLADQQREMERLVSQGKKSPEEALKIYQQKLELTQKKSLLEQRDDILLKIKSEVLKERNLYNTIGLDIIAKGLGHEVINKLIQIVSLNANRYSVVNGELQMHEDQKLKDNVRLIRAEIEEAIQKKITLLQKENEMLKSKNNLNDLEEIKTNQAAIDGLIKFKESLITDTEEALRSYDRQVRLVKTNSEFGKNNL